MNILTKQQSINLWTQGRLGNRLRTWDTTEFGEFIGTVSVRSKEVGGPCFYKVPVEEAINYKNCYFNETAPDDKLLIQGEFGRMATGYVLFYSTAKLPMRKALNSPDSVHLYNAAALFLLKHYLNANSISMLFELFDLYDCDVNKECWIEFSTYSINLGHLKGHNTVIWEVRSY